MNELQTERAAKTAEILGLMDGVLPPNVQKKVSAFVQFARKDCIIVEMRVDLEKARSEEGAASIAPQRL